MALGYNRKYNNLCGIPVSSSQLTPSAPLKGTIAVYSDAALPAFVETVPKTGAGLPTGDDAEQYVIDIQPSVYHLRVFANDAGAVSAGADLTHVVTAVAGTYSGNAKVGDLTQVDTAVTGLTFTALGTGHTPVVMRVLDGSSIAAAAAGDCEVIIGL